MTWASGSDGWVGEERQLRVPRLVVNVRWT